MGSQRDPRRPRRANVILVARRVRRRRAVLLRTRAASWPSGFDRWRVSRAHAWLRRATNGELEAYARLRPSRADSKAATSPRSRRTELAGDKSRVHSIAISPDGKTAAFSSPWGAVRYWNLETGLEIRRHAEIGRATQQRHGLECLALEGIIATGPLVISPTGKNMLFARMDDIGVADLSLIQISRTSARCLKSAGMSSRLRARMSSRLDERVPECSRLPLLKAASGAPLIVSRGHAAQDRCTQLSDQYARARGQGPRPSL
jgi:hypothetical protein